MCQMDSFQLLSLAATVDLPVCNRELELNLLCAWKHSANMVSTQPLCGVCVHGQSCHTGLLAASHTCCNLGTFKVYRMMFYCRCSDSYVQHVPAWCCVCVKSHCVCVRFKPVLSVCCQFPPLIVQIRPLLWYLLMSLLCFRLWSWHLFAHLVISTAAHLWTKPSKVPSSLRNKICLSVCPKVCLGYVVKCW